MENILESNNFISESIETDGTIVLKSNKKDKQKKNYIQLVELPFLQKTKEKNISENNIEIGDVIRMGYTLYEGTKEKVQYYEGIIIAKNNKQLGKSFTIRRNVQGIGVEQIFFLYSPKILSIVLKQASKVRRAKLYFLRELVGKKTKLKRRIKKIKD